ncbi:MAG: recombinase family protein [Acidobacteriales bacterium]|nr:recombinase family protein [Terriglobales bacterium]
MNAVIYCRVSSREQVEGTSLESQQLACEEYAHARNIHVLRVFVEQGESAKFADRTELLSLIEFCRENKGRVNTLLVWKVDRFARNVADHFSVKATLQRYGVDIVSVTEPIDTKPEGKLMETILAGFAQFDNDIRAARTVQGMRRKIQEGIFPWKPPLGYKSAHVAREKKNRPDEPDESLFGLLQKAWHQFATGVYTKAEMRRLMESWGIVSRKGVPLGDQSIDNLFRNPYYAGILIDPWSGEEYQGHHVPMVSRDEFAGVQQLVRKRSRCMPHHRHREEFPLRGLVRCNGCSQYLTASFSRGRSKRYPYYHCHNDNCSLRGKGLPVEKAHREFKEYLPLIAPKTELLDKLGEVAAKSAEGREKTLRSKRTLTRSTLNHLKQELQELIRMRSQRLISDEEFNNHKSVLAEKEQAIEATPKQAPFSTADIRSRLQEIAVPLHALLDTWNSLSPSIRSRFQRLIFPVGFTAGNIRTAQLGLLFNTLGDFARDESTLVPFTSNSWNQLYQEIQDFARVMKGEDDSKETPKKRVRRRSRKCTPVDELEPAS